MKKSFFAASALGAMVAGLAGPALADSITPSTYSATIGVGGTASIDKTITVNAGSSGVGQADVLFVIDTTGSMGTAISAVQSNLVSLVSSIVGNVGFGVAEYKDKTSGGDAFDYHLVQSITTSHASVQTALNSLSAGGGGDTPEQGLYALQQGSLAATGWRAGSKKIEVIVGDAPSHDATHPAAPAGVTVANVAAALAAAGIDTQAIDVGGGGLNSFGQFNGAGSIFAAGALGGYSASSYAAAAAAINDAIAAAFATYTEVSVQLVGAPAGVSVGLCAPITGSFDRSVDRNFNCSIDFTGVAPGTYDFSINALVDGGIIATELDHIVVTGDVPEPASMALLGAGLLGLAFARRRFS